MPGTVMCGGCHPLFPPDAASRRSIATHNFCTKGCLEHDALRVYDGHGGPELDPSLADQAASRSQLDL